MKPSLLDFPPTQESSKPKQDRKKFRTPTNPENIGIEAEGENTQLIQDQHRSLSHQKENQATKKKKKIVTNAQLHSYVYSHLEVLLLTEYGGAKSQSDQSQIRYFGSALNLVQNTFHNQELSQNFKIMIDNYFTYFNGYFDPLGQEFVPLTDLFFINLFSTKESHSMRLSLAQFLLIYSFQIYLNSSYAIFESFIRFFSLVLNKIENELQPISLIYDEINLFECLNESKESDIFIIYSSLSWLMRLVSSYLFERFKFNIFSQPRVQNMISN